MPQTPPSFDFAPSSVQLSLVIPILKTTADLIRGSLIPLLILMIIHSIGGYAIIQIASRLPTDLIYPASLAFSFALLAVISAAAIHTLLWSSHPQIDESLRVAFRAIVPFMAVSLAVQLITSIGFIVMVLPGLVAFLLLSLAPVFMMAERPSIQDALKTSAQVSIRFLITLALVFLAIAIIGGLIPLGVSVYRGITGAGAIPDADIAGTSRGAIIGIVARSASAILGAATATACYLHLRAEGQRIGSS